MPLARARRGDSGMNYWPGFVDALSTLILGIIFLLTVFVVVQFFLQQEITGKENQLSRLSAQLAQLTDLLAMEKANTTAAETSLSQLRASLAIMEADRDRYRGLLDAANANLEQQRVQSADLAKSAESDKKAATEALSQVEILNQQILAVRRQLAALQEALDARDKLNKENEAKIADLGSRLNVALAQRVQELSRFRSEFFGKLRDILGNRPDVRIVGDRFVFQSEVFFDAGKADLLPEGRAQIDKIADALLEIEKQIPPDIAWIMRVDGHTDIRPIGGAQFRSNYELSAGRAIAVVRYLVSKGVSPQRLVAAGFGEFQPVDDARTEEAFRRNRRIELKLTER